MSGVFANGRVAVPGRTMLARWAGLLVVVAGLLPAAAQAQAEAVPINRRFEVHRTQAGYELLGFRAQVGKADRFMLRAGMPAVQAREQMLSVEWGSSRGLSDPRSLLLWAKRTRFQNVVETVTVVLDPTGSSVQAVVYERQPALYSRAGLLRYLHAAFREGRFVTDRPDRLLVEYPPLDGQTLRVAATLLPGHGAQWRILYRMDAAPAPAGE